MCFGEPSAAAPFPLLCVSSCCFSAGAALVACSARTSSCLVPIAFDRLTKRKGATAKFGTLAEPKCFEHWA